VSPGSAQEDRATTSSTIRSTSLQDPTTRSPCLTLTTTASRFQSIQFVIDTVRRILPICAFGQMRSAFDQLVKRAAFDQNAQRLVNCARSWPIALRIWPNIFRIRPHMQDLCS